MKYHWQRLCSLLRSRLPLFVFCLFVIQPVMDILSFWIAELEWSNAPTLLLRFGVLGLTLLLGFALSRRKWVYWAAAAVCLLLTAGHVFAIRQFGITDLIGDLTNLIRVLQMPLSAICLITFLREHPDSYRAMKNGLLITEVSGLHAGANPVSGDFSLLSRGFEVAGGKIVRAVEQFTVAGNFYELLKNVTAVADDLLFEGSPIGSPSVAVSQLNIAGE